MRAKTSASHAVGSMSLSGIWTPSASDFVASQRRTLQSERLVAVIVHQRRHQDIRQADRAAGPKNRKSSRQPGNSRSMPIGSTTTRKDMRANFGAAPD